MSPRPCCTRSLRFILPLASTRAKVCAPFVARLREWLLILLLVDVKHPHYLHQILSPLTNRIIEACAACIVAPCILARRFRNAGIALRLIGDFPHLKQFQFILRH